MAAPEYAQNTITEYSIQPTNLYGEYRGDARYDLMSVVMICLGDSEKGFQKENSEYRKLLDLLTMISSHKIPVKQKLMTLEQDYQNNRNAIANMMKRLQLSFEESCDILQVNPEDYAELKQAQE